MNMINRTGRRILAFIMAVTVICSCCMNVLAEMGAMDLDMNQKGSVFVTLVDDNGEVMRDGTLAIYQVADLSLDDGNMVYTYKEAFAGCGEELTQDKLDAPAALAEKLAVWAEENGVKAIAEETIVNGEVSFSDIPLGLYLVVQTEKAEGFYLMDPFLVSVPHMEDGVWVYGVDAVPKVEVNASPETVPETPSTPDTATPSSPTADETPEETTLPQTGQLFWPIPVLTGLGALLFVIGAFLVRADKKKKHAK